MISWGHCRWLIELKTQGAIAPSQAEIVEALRSESGDDELRCLSEQGGSRVLILESSWEGYVRAYQKFVGQSLQSIAKLQVHNIEPAFDKAYAERIRQRDRATLENFVRIYGPLFRHAVIRESRRRGGAMDAFSIDQLLADVWQEFMAKIERVIEQYERAKGTQTGYLYHVVVNLIGDHWRRIRKRKEALVDPTQLDHPKLSSDPRALIEGRDFVVKVMETFRRECQERHQRTVPDDWQLCEMHHLRGVSKDTICQQYSMSSSNFDVRMMRIRARLLEIIDRLKN